MVTRFISHIYRNTRGRLPFIGVGGIFNAEDAYEKIKAGAMLCKFTPAGSTKGGRGQADQ
jgi:dihydroorotate dehydrogenase